MGVRACGLAVAVTACLAIAAAGCGGSGETPTTPSSRIIHPRNRPAGVIVLSATGAQRIGLRTAVVRAIPTAAGLMIVPQGAIVYDASGRTFVFKRVAPLQFTEVPVAVDHFTGSMAYLQRGPVAGNQVVSVGAEELFGVQTGVLAQT